MRDLSRETLAIKVYTVKLHFQMHNKFYNYGIFLIFIS